MMGKDLSPEVLEILLSTGLLVLCFHKQKLAPSLSTSDDDQALERGGGKSRPGAKPWEALIQE